MGASTFEVTSWGSTPQEAFSNAVDQAQYDYGNAGYTGTIAEKSEFTIISVPKQWEGNEEEYAYKLIDDGDPRVDDKWGPAGCILLESHDGVEKVPYATTVEKYPQEGTRKWETVFKVSSGAGTSFREFSSQTEAEKFAKEWVKETNQTARIRIEKKLVNGDQNIVTIRPKTKDVKIKNARNKYLFFGWASC
jgi:hypothetical protein